MPRPTWEVDTKESMAELIYGWFSHHGWDARPPSGNVMWAKDNNGKLYRITVEAVDG